MSDFWTAVLIVGCLAGYALIGGTVWVLVKDAWDDPVAFLGAVFWPLIAPVMAVVLFGWIFAVALPQKLVEVVVSIGDWHANRKTKDEVTVPEARVINE